MMEQCAALAEGHLQNCQLASQSMVQRRGYASDAVKASKKRPAQFLAPAFSVSRVDRSLSVAANDLLSSRERACGFWR